MTLSGHNVDDRLSCDRCLYVNRDLRRDPLPPVREMGEEGRNGWEDDMISTALGRPSCADEMFLFP